MNRILIFTIASLIGLSSCKKKSAEPMSPSDALTTSFSVDESTVLSYINPFTINQLYHTCPDDTASNRVTYIHDIINYDPNYQSSFYTLSIPYDSSVFSNLVMTNKKYPLSNVGDSCSIGMDFTYTSNGTAYQSINVSLTGQYMEFSKIVYGGQEVSNTVSYATYYLTGTFACIIQAGDTTLPYKVVSNGSFTTKALLRRR